MAYCDSSACLGLWRGDSFVGDPITIKGYAIYQILVYYNIIIFQHHDTIIICIY